MMQRSIGSRQSQPADCESRLTERRYPSEPLDKFNFIVRFCGPLAFGMA
jgi:hypothetical protein